MVRKGILLAGGLGTRLYPATLTVSKQLLPVYDKPLVYYPLSTLIDAGIREILVVTTPKDLPAFRHLLGDGSRWGLDLSYCAQPKPGGIAQSLLLGKEFLDGKPSALILGDNLFYGHGFKKSLMAADKKTEGATVFAYRVSNPERYGVVGFDKEGLPLSIEEKPERPKSKYVVTGLYFYDGTASHVAESLKPSGRGELEITDVNRAYLERKQLNVEKLSRGFAWLDAGTKESFLDATAFVAAVEKRQGLKIGSPEEAAYRAGFVSAEQLLKLASRYDNEYGSYLRSIAD